MSKTAENTESTESQGSNTRHFFCFIKHEYLQI